MTAIYLKNAVRRWQAALRSGSEKVMVISPFLTSDTAETVLRCTSPALCEIYTSFSAELFASGGSSLRTLETLATEGFILYDLPGLHAKIIVVPGVCVTIGSQNLTRGGTKNREATVVLTDAAEIKTVAKDLQKWLLSRRLITLEMIADLKLALPPLVRRSLSLRRDFEEIDDRVRAATARREGQRLVELQRRLAEMPQAQETVIARVSRVEQPPLFFFSSPNQTHTLLAKPGDNLTRWKVDGRVVRLERMYRYICLHGETGKLGWARVGKTRITFVGDEITGIQMMMGEWLCHVEFTANWERHVADQANLKIKLAMTRSNDGATVSCWFGVDSLSVLRIKSTRRSRVSTRLLGWLRENEAEFRKQMLTRLSQPFRYEHNRLGVEATSFFGPIGTRTHLRLALIGENPLIYSIPM